MVIGPYDKRLKRSRCLNCMARHTKARRKWSADKDKRRSNNSLVFWRYAMLVLCESLDSLSICESDKSDHSNR
jgi:hypothetical protein